MPEGKPFSVSVTLGKWSSFVGESILGQLH